MTTNLKQASNQWANRTPDERFESLNSAHEAALAVRNSMVTANATLKGIKAVPVEGDGIKLVGTSGRSADITNWAFKQLATKIGFSGTELAKLDSDLASDVINHMIQKQPEDSNIMMLMDSSNLTIRSVTSDRYALFPQSDVFPFLKKLGNNGWKLPPARPAFAGQPGTRPATKDDVLANNSGGGGISINEGDLIAPAGLYMGDRDMFCFMVNTENQIDDGTGRKWNRGFFLTNSEVGASSFILKEFWFANVCGNHIVWDATKIIEERMKHIGNAYERIQTLLGQAFDRLTAGINVKERTQTLQLLRTTELGADKDSVIENLYKQRISPVLTQKLIRSGFEAAEVYGDIDGAKPQTVLGLVHGLTRHSQTVNFADERMAIDAAAGSVMDYFTKVLDKSRSAVVA